MEGNYLIAYTVEKACWSQNPVQGKLLVENPQKENAYIGIAVHHASNLRFVKELMVTVTLFGENGTVIGRHYHAYHQRPGLPHYGKNWILPGDGFYTIQVQIDALDLIWEGLMGGKFTSNIIELEFPHVMITTGQQFS
jgi:hypothetical protein